MLNKLPSIVLTFWLGALWFAGIAANMLFNTLDDKQIAGGLAGQLFTTVSYIGMASALYLLGQSFLTHGKAAVKRSIVVIIFVMLLINIIGHFGIQLVLVELKNMALPGNVMDSEYAKQFATWHGVAGVFYLIQCVLGIALVCKTRFSIIE